MHRNNNSYFINCVVVIKLFLNNYLFIVSITSRLPNYFQNKIPYQICFTVF